MFARRAYLILPRNIMFASRKMATSSASEGAASEDGLKLSVCSMNLLSPGYFRKSDRSDKRKRVEASHYSAWHPRLLQQFSALNDLQHDVAMLQEFWCKPPVFALLHDVMGNGWCVVSCQRTGKKEDGVLLLVNRSKWTIAAERCVHFNDAGDRCLAIALIRPTHPTLQNISSEQQAADVGIIVATTHLTFPHDESVDAPIRLEQSCRIVREIDSFAVDNNAMDAPVVLGGDFNGPCSDPAVQKLLQCGYRSSYSAVNGREAAITHLDHAGHAAGVDFVFWRQGGYLKQRRKSAASLVSALKPTGVMFTSISSSGSAGESFSFSSSSSSEEESVGGAAAASSIHRHVAVSLTPLSATLLPAGVPDNAVMCRPIVQHPADLAVAAAAALAVSAPLTPAAGTASSSPSAPLGDACTLINGSSGALGDHRERTPIAPLEGQSPTSSSSSSSASNGTSATEDGAGEGAQSAAPVGVFSVTRRLCDLSFHDWCQMTDHRAVSATFRVDVSSAK